MNTQANNLTEDQNPSIVLPAEWDPQLATQIAWPHAAADWGKQLESAEACFSEIAAAISQYQTVVIIIDPTLSEMHVREQIKQHSFCQPNNLHFVSVPNRDVWARDHGPIISFEHIKTAKNPLSQIKETAAAHTIQAVVNDFQFNGWGGKFPAELDNRITKTCFGHHLFENPLLYRQAIYKHQDLTLEGGAIETDGHGTLMATRKTLIDPNRNPASNQHDIEFELNKELGLQHFLWLDHGELIGDDTDGHIDTLARFINPHTIMYQACDDKNDAHFLALQKMAEQLAEFKQPNGEKYHLIPLPLPTAQYNDKKQRLPAGYANFLFVNNAVIVPIYDVETDQEALDIFVKAFPDRDVLGINCQALIQQNGSLHCATMHYPAFE